MFSVRYELNLLSVVEVASLQTVKTELDCFHHILLNAPFVNKT